MNKNKFCVLISVLILLITIISIYFETVSTAFEDYNIGMRFKFQLMNFDNGAETNGSIIIRERKILLWNTMFNDEYFYLGKTGHFDNCVTKFNNCRLTRSRDNLNSYDAVLFHGNELLRDDLPGEREPNQYYVFVNLESPINRPITDPYFEDYFNITMTYRLDSDVPWPYKIVRNIETGQMVAPLKHVEWMEPNFENFNDEEYKKRENKFNSKKKIAVWLVSNCKTHGKREFFVDELKKYVQVDIIGNCAEPGAVKCPRSKDCFAEMVESDYFFYLSFENSLCQDYVTEKLFNALRYDVIPVVYGGGNYSLFAPPHSYIDALDFDSPKMLANFLIKLSENREEYLKYFWWKKFYTVDSSKSWTLCKLCEMLNKPKTITTKSYSHLSNWYSKYKCPIHDNLKDGHFATKDSRSRILARET